MKTLDGARPDALRIRGELAEQLELDEPTAIAHAPGPVGEYAQSVLGRERIFEHFSAHHGTAMCALRLNYAIDLRYGVLLDIGTQVYEDRPVDVPGSAGTAALAIALAADRSMREGHPVAL